MGRTLTVDEDRVKELATLSPQWASGLKKLFPMAFEDEDFAYFRCGTIFRVTVSQKDQISELPKPKVMARKSMYSQITKPTMDRQGVAFDDLVMLIHGKDRGEYHLVCLGTGYQWEHQHRVYKRKPKGVEIPKKDLRFLEFWSDSNVTTKT